MEVELDEYTQIITATNDESAGQDFKIVSLIDRTFTPGDGAIKRQDAVMIDPDG